MKARGSLKRPPQVPLSAMSDIAMLLLIFFAVTTQFLVQQRMNVELPSVTNEKQEASEDLITVYVEQEQILLDIGQVQERIEPEEVQRLAEYLAAKFADATSEEERAVVVDADPDVSYEMVIAAMEQVERAGGVIVPMKMEN